MHRLASAALAAVILATSGIASAADMQPLDAFARLPRMRSVALSPEGKRLVFITSVDDRSFAVVNDIGSSQQSKVLISSEPGKYDISWCNWANESRMLCGLRGVATERGTRFPFTRLVGINADGSGMKMLIYNAKTGQAQFHDGILDWTPDEPDTVLIQLDDDANGYPSVFELDVNTGRLNLRLREHPPIRWFVTDAKGNVRLGSGYESNPEIHYFARLENEDEWRRLAKIKVFTESDALRPIAVAPGTNKAYAVGDYEGRSALWEMDLTDRQEPQLVFSHPLVDASRPILTADGRLLGIRYELDRPFIYYTDQYARDLMGSIGKAVPDSFNFVSDYTRDEKTLVIQSFSDVDDSTYFILDKRTSRLLEIGRAYPELNRQQLGRMRSITYKAADGTEIPGYLTVPVGVRAEKLPLIVMPHGGPISRDSWDFFFLRAFLVDRGYAVLQMNFRGSSGYGNKWFFDAHQDWGGLTYDDITDGARWAVAQGIADPKRMCIVGWSFGGYAALLGAVRNGDLYRCSVSIAGVSDLNLLLSEARNFSSYRFTREQIGIDRAKLREDSPLRHVDEIGIPVLLVHGDRDYQVEVDHSRKMAAALKRARKAHKAVFIDHATHQLDRKSDRVTLLSEIEKFLRENLGPGVSAGG